MPLIIFGDDPRCTDALFTANAVRFKRPEAIRFAHGVLSPGAYNNNRALPSHPSEWDIVLQPMIRRASQLRHEYDVIASVATGGIIHGGAIARALEVPHVIVKKQEKGHGLGGLIDGDAGILPGKRVLLVEDMSSTFQSCLKAMEPLKHEGAVVMHTLLISTWNLPDFAQNVGEHQVHTLCTGAMFVVKAIHTKLVDDEHGRILQHWLQHPEDESWTQDGTWELPK